MPRLIEGFTKPIEYPEADGKPVTEGDLHFNVFSDFWLRMKAWAAGKGDCYFGGGLFVYYREGDPRIRLVPDGFVAFGAPPGNRDTFQTWREGTAPSVVFEITSRKTRRYDMGKKWRVYQDVWRVSELFLFDPRGDYLKPWLQGFRRSRTGLVPIRPTAAGSVRSRKLGLLFSHMGHQLRLHHATTGAIVPTEDERRGAAELELRERIERQAAKANAEKKQLVTENERLRAENAALRKKK